MKPLISVILLAVITACLGGDPPQTVQPVIVIQQTGQLLITDKSPQPVVVLPQPQQTGQTITTATGQLLLPLNTQQKEGSK